MPYEEFKEEEFPAEESRISKSQVKRELQALRDMGKELVELRPAQLLHVPMSESLRDAVLRAKELKMKALKRQLQHIGVLLREDDAQAIREGIDAQTKPSKKQVMQHHQTERWRDQLIAGDADIMTELLNRFPDADHQHFRQLVRNAIKEKKQEKPPKSSRQLFRYLVELRENEQSC